jgi:single-stranded DNA-binding protein
MGDFAFITIGGNVTKNAEATPMDQDPSRLRVDFTVASSYYDRTLAPERGKAFYPVRIWMNRKRWDTVNTWLAQGSRIIVRGILKPRKANNGGMFLNIEDADIEPNGATNNQQQDAPQTQQPQYGQAPVAAAPTGYPAGPQAGPPGAYTPAPAPAPVLPPAPAPVAAAPTYDTTAYHVDPQYPGQYFSHTAQQWVQGAPPSNAPPPAYGAPPPAQMPMAPPAGAPPAGPPMSMPQVYGGQNPLG